MKTLKAVIELEVNCSEELIQKLGSMEAVAKQFQDQLAHELKLREYGKVKVTVNHLSDKDAAKPDGKPRRKRRTKAEMEEARRRGEA
jgi:hypothetical protein